MGAGLTTENIMVDNNDMESPGLGDRINQRDTIRCGERTMLKRLNARRLECVLSDLTEAN